MIFVDVPRAYNISYLVQETGKRRTGYLLYKDIYRSATGMSRSTSIILPNYGISFTLLREYNISPVSILFLFLFVKDFCTVGRMICIDVIIPVALLYISLYRKYHSPYGLLPT
jgi:hypothetical protein